MGFANLSRNQVIIFDINSLWVFAGQRSGASHLANVVQKCICKIWPTSPHARHNCHGQVLKHKRNPIRSQWSSWMLSYFQDQSWANLHLTFGMDWLLPGHWSFRLCRIFSLLSSSLLAWTRPTWICKSSHIIQKNNKLFVIAIIMVYPRSVFCLNDRKWVQWRIGVARFVTPTRHEAVRSLLLWLVSDCQHCSSHMTEPRRNDARVEQKSFNSTKTASLGFCISCSKPCPTLGIVLFVFQPSRSRNAAPIVQLYFHSLGLQAQAPEAPPKGDRLLANTANDCKAKCLKVFFWNSLRSSFVTYHSNYIPSIASFLFTKMCKPGISAM